MKNLKKLLFTALLLLCSTVAFAQVVVDGITYYVVSWEEEATVIAGETKYSGDIVIPETIECDGVICTVTSIGSDAFFECEDLTSVVIGNSVTSIGEWAFNNCSGLTSVVIGNSVTSIGERVFAGCSGLTSVVIGNSVTSIGYYAFGGCSGLTSIEIPNSVTSIEAYAFSGCSGLTSVEIGNSVMSIGEGAFGGSGLTSVEIPNSVTSIGEGAFGGCSSLASVVIGNSVTSIGGYAFSDCSRLSSIVIPNSVTSIGNSAFQRCTGLTSIEIPNSVTSIGDEAFYACTGLTSVVIGNGVTSIGDEAFFNDYRLKTVINLSSLTFSKGTYDNGNVALFADKVINAPNGYIDGDYVWSTLNGVNTLAGYLGNVTVLKLPENCKGEQYGIGDGAFRNLTGLRSIRIPSNVTTIGEYAFADCEELLDVYCFGFDVPAASATAFEGSNPENVYLHVNPEGATDLRTFEEWKKAGMSKYHTTEPWNTFGNIIPVVIFFSITDAGYATLYLDYAVDILAPAEVYIAKAVEGEYLKMQLVDGVIPANTGVIVKADAGTYQINTIDNTVPAVEDNLFKGSVEDKMVKVASGEAAYVLSMVDGEVGMYRAELTDGAFLNNANKAYLLLGGNRLGIYDKEFDTSTGGQLSNGYRFDFSGITGISEVKGQIGEVKGIYDLQGRKVENPTNGIYIINGKKVLVK